MSTRMRLYPLLLILSLCFILLLVGCDNTNEESPTSQETIDVEIEIPQGAAPPPPEQSEPPSEPMPTATTDGTLTFPVAFMEVSTFSELMSRVEADLSISPTVEEDGSYTYSLDAEQRERLLAFLRNDFDRIRSSALEEDMLQLTFSEDYVELYLLNTPALEAEEDPLMSPWIEESFMNSILHQSVRGVAYGELFFIVRLEDRLGEVIDSHHYVPSEMYH